MTCKQYGGAFDKKFQANTFEKMAEFSLQYAMEMIESNDEVHLETIITIQKLMKKLKAMSDWFMNKEKI